MRIIAGKYRGRILKSPPSLATRPTSDRLRETLFNILTPRIEGARFLDLCAGTGAVGIEALSRGAAQVTFVDQSRKMCALIGKNIDLLQIGTDESEIVEADAFEFLRRVSKKERRHYDIVFFDPPYAADYETILTFMGEQAARLLRTDAVVVVEHDKRRELPEMFASLTRYRTLKQGDSCLSFYRVA